MKTNNRVERFIRDTLSVDEEKGEIIISLREIILKTSPDAHEEIKYGGIVFSVDSELISGIFVRKKHVSLEFGFGMKMSDPEGYLEGKGKYRRHLKLMNENEIVNKNVAFFVTQAFEQCDYVSKEGEKT